MVGKVASFWVENTRETTTLLLPEPIEIFFAGDHTCSTGEPVSVDAHDLERSVSSFNRSGGLLPLVVGHPQDDGPAYGWAERLVFDRGRVKIAAVRGVDPTFQQIVNSGELPNVSVKLRLPGHPSNKSGVPEFVHVGFLGKSPPALSLPEARFAAPDPLEPIITMTTINSPPPSTQEAEFAAAKSKLEAEKALFDLQVAEFQRARSIEPEIEKLVRDGRLLPAEKEGFVALFSRLSDDFQVEFQLAGTKKTVPAAQFLREFLSGLKPRVTYQEISRETGAPVAPPEVKFSAPPGYSVNQSAAELDAKAKAYCEEKGWNPLVGGNYSKALRLVQEGA